MVAFFVTAGLGVVTTASNIAVCLILAPVPFAPLVRGVPQDFSLRLLASIVMPTVAGRLGADCWRWSPG